MTVWVEFMNSRNLTLSIISGGFPHNLNEEEVRWLVGVLQEALGEKQRQAEGSGSPASAQQYFPWPGEIRMSSSSRERAKSEPASVPFSDDWLKVHEAGMTWAISEMKGEITAEKLTEVLKGQASVETCRAWLEKSGYLGETASEESGS